MRGSVLFVHLVGFLMPARLNLHLSGPPVLAHVSSQQVGHEDGVHHGIGARRRNTKAKFQRHILQTSLETSASLLETSALLVVTGALLVVTRSYLLVAKQGQTFPREPSLNQMFGMSGSTVTLLVFCEDRRTATVPVHLTVYIMAYACPCFS